MANYRTSIDAAVEQSIAFDYLCDFSNVAKWDPSVPSARRLGKGKIRKGARFEVDLEVVGRRIVFDYSLIEFEPNHRLVFEAVTPILRSLDTIEIEKTDRGSRVRYDADLRLRGAYSLFDLPLHLGFQVSGRRSAKGLARALARLA